MSKHGGYYQDVVMVDAGFTPGAMSTANGTGIDMKGYRTAILYANVKTGAAKTFDMKVQTSADNSTFADLTSGAITQITANDTNAQIVVDCTQVPRYLRGVITAGSSPVAYAVWLKKDPLYPPATQDADETVTPHT